MYCESGPIIFLGGLLLLITSILEFILGNTFPCVVFGTIGKSSRTGDRQSCSFSDIPPKEDSGLPLQLP